MYEQLINDIKEIYSIILQPCDITCKLSYMEIFKNKYNFKSMLDIIPLYYSQNKSKEKGIVYTPIYISQFMIKNTINKKDILNNPFVKIIDPACGCGNIIIPCFEYLIDIYRENVDEINSIWGLNLSEDSIKSHIIKYNIYGTDIDEISIIILKIIFFENAHEIPYNIKASDFLFEADNKKYDIILSNPPYVGHKSISREYFLNLKKSYSSVYKDKSDISYCFYYNSIKRVKDKGKITIISSRYFMEALNGNDLRKFIADNCIIEKIVDFYGIRPFKSVGIDPVILFINKSKKTGNKIKMIRADSALNCEKFKEILINNTNDINEYYINQSKLRASGWSLISDEYQNIITKIENKCAFLLSDICLSYQGIITGCDKAFILKKEDILKYSIENKVIKPWIKSSNVQRSNVTLSDKYIIFSDIIDNPIEYKNAISYIERYKERLIKRRECKNGIRKWYGLQWGRKQEIFEKEKIIFPYKADSNRFAKDKGNYFSADVYSLMIKDNSIYTYEFLVKLLNSRLYEFYFKSYAKKLGARLYEYYPNNIMKLRIPVFFEFESENQLHDYFNLSKPEKNIINQCIKKYKLATI